MSGSETSAGRFILFDDPEPSIEAGSAAFQFYALVEKLREAVRSGKPRWARLPTMRDYADICFWAIRRQEYRFVTEAFASWETQWPRALRVLDVGCGVVPLCNWLSVRGHDVTAIDPIDKEIALLREHDLNEFYGSSVDYRCESCETLPFDDASFDAVTCVSVLEQIPTGNDYLALMEMARVLRPGGRLFITFDVGPPSKSQEGEQPWPGELRRIEHPFTEDLASRLFERLTEVFDLSALKLPERLGRLSWREVHGFWRATQKLDGRDHALRHYLAVGGVLDRTDRPARVERQEAMAELLDGQRALRHRLEFYRHHADVRLRILEQSPSWGRRARQLLLGAYGEPSLPARLERKARGAAHLARAWLWQGTAQQRWARRRLGPRLGLLRQHAPRPLRLPPPSALSHLPERAPTFSIVTPSYNGAAFLERTIRSVVDQDYPAVQYVVQDAGSKDGTVEILERYAGRLHHFASEPDDGQAQAINRGFARTDGSIMAYLNADDLLLPGTLSYVATYLLEHPDVGVVYGHRVLIDSEDREIGRWIMPPHSDEVFRWACYLPQETMFWRRSLWEKTGGQIDESFDFAMDWDLILRFISVGAKFVRLPRFLAAFRVHEAQKTLAIMEQVGQKEMDRLLRRVHGRSINGIEIRRNTRRYLMSHLGHHLAYRAGLVRY
jgi:SAM-dependent methyltransferase